MMERPRRNPKRKVSETADENTNADTEASNELASDLLEKACSPLTPHEIEEWQGWIELESEPAFFNIILQDLGVKHVKAQELFTIDQISLDALSKPVFGLIFLFQYEPGDEEQEHGVDPDNQIWFANQTTNNACATVALLNIIMNAGNLDLGEELQSFKESTKDLSTALRGHSISSNSFIRKIHNSFTRRMDHLNADLCLENEIGDSKKTKSSKASSQSQKSKKAALDYGYHFVAYVPSDGYVWELDGLKSNPVKLGAIDAEDWTVIARPQIEARMLQYEDSQLSFNLLAVCRGPLLQYSRTIASMVAALGFIQSQMADSALFRELISAEEVVLDTTDQTQLDEFSLLQSDIQNAELPPQLRHAACRSQWEVQDAYDMYQKYRIEARASMGEFRAEVIAMEEDQRRVKGRRRDYGSALHCWVRKLAEKGVLEDIIKMSS